MPASRYIIGSLPWYSVLVVSGMALAIFLAGREEQRLHLPKDTIIDLAFWLLPSAIIGARIYYVLFSWDFYRENLLEIFAIWHGGLAIYGGIIGGLLALLFFARKHQIKPLLLLDIVVPGVALAQAIGRWGNFFNMEAYGPLVSRPSLQFFPLCVRIPVGATFEWHFATFFVSSLYDLGLFLFLWGRRKKVRRTGETFFLYLLFYASGRLVLEELRTDALMSIQYGLRVSQVLSMLLSLIALAWLSGVHVTKRISIRQNLPAACLTLGMGLLSQIQAPSETTFLLHVSWCLLSLWILITICRQSSQSIAWKSACLYIAIALMRTFLTPLLPDAWIVFGLLLCDSLLSLSQGILALHAPH